jgi:hypothetical protein
MKKILYFLLLLAYNSVVMAQSTLITPGKNQQESPSGDNITIKSSSGFLGIQSLRYNGTSTSKTAVMANDELLNIGGSGFFTSSSSNFDNALIQMTATQNWNSTSQGTKINFFTTANGTNSKSHRMIIDQNGEVGIGVINPEGNLHVHQPQSVVGKFKLTNNNTGISATDGLDLSVFTSDDLLHPLGAGILNKENNSLLLGTNNNYVVNINNAGNVGINNLLNSGSTGRFQVSHNTGNANTYPHINLKTLSNASNGIIRMENFEGNRFFGQYFNLASTTAANNFYSIDYNGTTPILDLAGNGNVKVSGFTTLGNDASAPRIKMKTLTSTTGSTQGGVNSPDMNHGVTASKIISVSVFVDYGFNFFVPPGFVAAPGEQYDYQITGSKIETFNHPTNSINILNKPIKVVITYIE